MNLAEKTKTELEHRVQQMENFVSDQRRALSNVSFTQRETNIAMIVGGVLIAAGVAIWMLSDAEEDDSPFAG